MTSSAIAPGEPLLRLDHRAFAEDFAKRPFSVGHSLAGHPLLTLEAIAALADEMPPGAVERHRANLGVVMPGGAPEYIGSPSAPGCGIQGNDRCVVVWNLAHVPSDILWFDPCLD